MTDHSDSYLKNNYILVENIVGKAEIASYWQFYFSHNVIFETIHQGRENPWVYAK